MNIFSKFITMLVLLLITSSAYASNYNLDVYSEINKLGLSDLRKELSKNIHELEEPWSLSYYKNCLLKKQQEITNGKVFKEKCDRFLNELPEDRYVRLELIVDAIILELNNAEDRYHREWFWNKRDLALMLLIKMHNESDHFNLDVHTGKVKGDSGKSACLAMVWSRSIDKYSQKELIGYDKDNLSWSLRQTRNCVEMGNKHLIFHSYRCLAGEKVPKKYKKDYSKIEINQYAIARIFRGYGSGYGCNPEFAIKKINGNEVKVKLTEPLRRARHVWKLRNM